MNRSLHLWEGKNDTPEVDGSALYRPNNVFEKGGENHVYHLFTYTLLNSALWGKGKKKYLKCIQANLTGQPETEIPNTVFKKYFNDTCPI